MSKMAVILSGGLVSDVFCDDKEIIEKLERVTVVDLDASDVGGDDCQMVKIPNMKNEELAWITEVPIEEGDIVVRATDSTLNE